MARFMSLQLEPACRRKPRRANTNGAGDWSRVRGDRTGLEKINRDNPGQTGTNRDRAADRNGMDRTNGTNEKAVAPLMDRIEICATAGPEGTVRVHFLSFWL